MISIHCPSCCKLLKVKEELAGKRGKCPDCGTAITVPAASESPVAAPSGLDGMRGPSVEASRIGQGRTKPPAPGTPAEPPTLPPSLLPLGPAAPESSGADSVAGKAGHAL